MIYLTLLYGTYSIRKKEQYRAYREELEELSNLVRNGGEIENSPQAYFDELFNKTMNYGNNIVTEAGITIMHPDGVLQYPTEEEEEQYISQIRNAFENGEI